MLLITNQLKCCQRTQILHLSTERSQTDKISFKRYHNIISQIVIKIDHLAIASISRSLIQSEFKDFPRSNYRPTFMEF